MEKNIIGTIGFLAMLCITLPASAADPNQVRQLLETGECSGCDLTQADLSNTHLLGADLRNANLEGANLTNTNLEGADLTSANLRATNFTGALMTNTSLNLADLTQANLASVKMYNAETAGAVLTGINTQNAQVFGSGINIGGD